jgi:hypothetical protein
MKTSSGKKATDEMLYYIGQLSREEAIEKLIRLIQMPHSPKKRKEIARVVMGTRLSEGAGAPRVQIASNRSVQVKAVLKIYESKIINYIDEFIQAALDPRGPFQTREIMMIADQMKGGGAWFITADGIPQADKNMVGHILSMAGFERVSHYDKATGKPIKAWKVAQGWTAYTPAQRGELVRGAISEIVTKHLIRKEDTEVLAVPPLLGKYI